MTNTTKRPTYANINETRDLPSGITVQRYRIIGTPMVDYVAMEPLAGHSTICSLHDGRRLGKITTRPLPIALAGMKPGSKDRAELVRGFYDASYAESYAAIVEAFPEAADGTRCMGMVTTTTPAEA